MAQISSDTIIGCAIGAAEEAIGFVIADDLLLRGVEAQGAPQAYEAFARCTSVVEMWASSIGE